MAGWTIDVSATAVVRGPDGLVHLRAKERAIVAALALHHPAPASATTLAPLIWGDEPPATAVKSIHNHVSRLRRQVPDLIETSTSGYHFGDDIVIESSGAITSYEDLADQRQVTLARARDRNVAIEAAERRIRRELRAGANDELCARLEVMVDAAPQRFIRWWWLALVTARLGRRQQALTVLRECRHWHGLAGARGNDDAAARRAIDRLEQAIIADDLFIESPAALAPEAIGAATPVSASTETAPGLADPTGAIARLVEMIDTGTSSTLLTAPAGGGKTSAVRSLAHQLPPLGWHCFTTSCSPIETDPLHPIAELVDARREREGSSLPHETVAPRPVGGSTGDRAAALLDLVCAPTNRRVLLIVDDAHHADQAARVYLDRLVDVVNAADGHVALVIASRVGEFDADVSARHELPDWDLAAVQRFLHVYVTPGSWADGAAEWIARASGGSPLSARDLMIDALRDVPDDPVSTPFVARIERPSPTDSATRRLDGLPGHTMTVLQVAAVLGDEFRRSDLLRIESGTTAAIALAEARGLLDEVDDDRLRFAHQTFRRSILSTLDDDEVIDLAQRAAAVIGTSSNRADRLGEIAYFARLASPRDPEAAISATVDEVRNAFAAKRFDETLTTSRMALQLIGDHEGRSARWCEIGVLAGKVGIDVGAPDAVDLVTAAGERAIELGEHDIVGEATWALCALSPITAVGTIGDIQRRFLTHSLAHVVDPAVRARVCAGGSFAWALADVPATSRELYFEAEAVSKACADPHVRADVLLCAYTPLSRPGDVPLRREVAAELHELGARYGHIEYTYEACRLDFGDAIHWGTNDPRPAMRRIEEIAATLNQRGRNWSLTAFRATEALLDADFRAAERHANHLLTNEVTASEQLVLSTYGAHLLAIRLAQGRISEIDPMVADLMSRQPQLEIWRAVRCLTAAEVDPDVARTSFDSVFHDGEHSIPPSFTMLSGLVAAGEGVWRLGDDERMHTMVEHLTPYADRWSWFNVGTIGPVDLTLARLHRKLGHGAEARRAAERGLRSTLRVGAPHFTAQLADTMLGLD